MDVLNCGYRTKDPEWLLPTYWNEWEFLIGTYSLNKTVPVKINSWVFVKSSFFVKPVEPLLDKLNSNLT